MPFCLLGRAALTVELTRSRGDAARCLDGRNRYGTGMARHRRMLPWMVETDIPPLRTSPFAAEENDKQQASKHCKHRRNIFQKVMVNGGKPASLGSLTKEQVDDLQKKGPHHQVKGVRTALPYFHFQPLRDADLSNALAQRRAGDPQQLRGLNLVTQFVSSQGPRNQFTFHQCHDFQLRIFSSRARKAAGPRNQWPRPGLRGGTVIERASRTSEAGPFLGRIKIAAGRRRRVRSHSQFTDIAGLGN